VCVCFSRSVAAQSGPKPGWLYRIWGLVQERVYETPLRDTSDLKQRLIDTMGKFTKRHRRSCWSMEKAVMCMHEGERPWHWTSAKLKRARLITFHTSQCTASLCACAQDRFGTRVHYKLSQFICAIQNLMPRWFLPQLERSLDCRILGEWFESRSRHNFFLNFVLFQLFSV